MLKSGVTRATALGYRPDLHAPLLQSVERLSGITILGLSINELSAKLQSMYSTTTLYKATIVIFIENTKHQFREIRPGNQ